MITSAFYHCRGIGRRRLELLESTGIRSWHDVVNTPDQVPPTLRNSLVRECQEMLEALEQDAIETFVRRFDTRDKWRILHHYLDRTSFFDIETTGLNIDDTITVIVCWHRGRFYTFVEHENLDDFLDLLEDVELLASFNGSMFDVPRVLSTFHISELPCPHLDLRWIARQQNLTGGLKRITQRLGIHRPGDLTDVDGAQAVQWWWAWRLSGDEKARADLIRYCAADVALLLPLAEHVTGRQHWELEELWRQLPPDSPIPADRSRLL